MRCCSKSIRRQRRAFTLLELLIVIVIIGIIAAFSLGAFVTALGTAKVTATEAMLQNVGDMLNDRLESYMSTTRGATFTADADSEIVAAGDRRRAKVIARLEGMRAAFPQELGEFMNLKLGTTDLPEPGGYSFITKGPITDYQNAVMEAVKKADADPNIDATSLSFKRLLLENESAECLYLIIRHYAREAMSSTVDDIPTRFIRDTDGDGLLEIVDAWENPVRFYRWPTDLLAYYIEVEQSMPKEWMRVSNLDPDATLIQKSWYELTTVGLQTAGRATFENVDNAAWVAGADPRPQRRPRYFRLHAAYSNTSNPSLPPGDPLTNGNQRSYPLIPVIVSAGPDGLFGMHYAEVNSAGDYVYRPNESGLSDVATDLSARCGRVDASTEETLAEFSDNLVSLKLRSGETQ